MGTSAPRARRAVTSAVSDTLTDVRVVIADDHRLVLDGIKRALESDGGFEIVGETQSGTQVLPLVGKTNPDLVLLDVRMPGMGGIEVARRLVASHPEVVVVLISIEERIDVPSAAQLDAVPLVRKQDFGPRLLRRLWSERRR